MNFFKSLAAFLAAVLIFGTVFRIQTSAVTFTPNFTVSSEAAALINLDKDIVVYEKNPTKKMYPASLTKIMTAIIVLAHL